VLIVPNPRLLLVEGEAPQYLSTRPSTRELGLQVDIKDDASDPDPASASSALKRQEMERHSFEIDCV
jgi:hypothetical protein